MMDVEISPGIKVHLGYDEIRVLASILITPFNPVDDDNGKALRTLMAKSIITRTKKAGVTRYAIRPGVNYKVEEIYLHALRGRAGN